MKTFVKVFFFVFCHQIILMAQDAQVDKVLNSFDRFRQNNYQEKIYVHTDKDFYLVGEIIWFKLYYVNGVDHKEGGLSKVAYVELLDHENEPVIQAKVELQGGSGEGSFYIPGSVSTGTFKFRAYTSWMKNYGNEFYFEKEVKIVNTIFQQEINIEDSESDFKMSFFPEGGHLVNNLQSKVGFKGYNMKGEGFTASLLDQHNDTLLHFSPLANAIGSFVFTPQKGNRYKAVVKHDNGAYSEHFLPTPQEDGYVLSLASANPSVTATVSGTENMEGKEVLLFVHTRNILKAIEKKLIKKGVASFIIDPEILGDGISHFTVFDQSLNPIAERLFFKQPQNLLTIHGSTDKAKYKTKEKVEVQIDTKVKDLSAQANLSVAVFLLDSLQKDHLNKDNILSYLYLTSDLKGRVENPGYYFSDHAGALKAADNLMLTQGWRRFEWTDVLKEEKTLPLFPPEPDAHIIKGKITRKENGNPVSAINAYLSVPGKDYRFYVDQSNANGELNFLALNYTGGNNVILQHEGGSSFNIDLLSPFCNKVLPEKPSFFLLDEKYRETLREQSIGIQALNIYHKEGTRKFSFQKQWKPFYSKADYSYSLDDYTRFSTMEEVLREYMLEVRVRLKSGDYNLRVLDVANKTFFPTSPLVLVDGVPVFNPGNKILNYDPLKVEKLEVISQEYIINNFIAEGVLSFTTYKGNLEEFPIGEEAFITNYEGLQLKREYYSPKYGNEDAPHSRLPDPRSLIYWNPQMKSDGSLLSFDFYTSDRTGSYLVVLEGLSSNGEPGAISLSFDVEDVIN